MPVYSYRCAECGAVFEKTVVREDFSKPQSCDCGYIAPRVVGDVNFVLKGDGWVGKNQKIKGQMAMKNRRLDEKSRERRHDASVRLAPNVGGERVEDWEDAKKLAASKGLSTESYDTKIRQEKKAS